MNKDKNENSMKKDEGQWTWKKPQMWVSRNGGIPLVIIHFRLGFSLTKTIQLLGYPHGHGNPQMGPAMSSQDHALGHEASKPSQSDSPTTCLARGLRCPLCSRRKLVLFGIWWDLFILRSFLFLRETSCFHSSIFYSPSHGISFESDISDHLCQFNLQWRKFSPAWFSVAVLSTMCTHYFLQVNVLRRCQ